RRLTGWLAASPIPARQGPGVRFSLTPEKAPWYGSRWEGTTVTRRYSLALVVIGFALLYRTILPTGFAWAARACGNGGVEGGEECDPGGELHCDGNPSLPTCTTGAQCAGGTNCYFAFSCCKFNCQFVGQGASCFDGNQCTDGDHCDNVGRCVGQF